MEYRNEIGNGYELGDLLWSGARTNFGEWLDKGADADDILSCVEEYLGYGEELPTLTDINDFLWFEPETVESYLGLSSDDEDDEIESARKNKSSRKPIKSMAAVSRDKLMDAGSLGDTIMRDLKLNSIINDPNDCKYPIERGKERDSSQYYLDIKGFGEIEVLVNQDNYRTNRRNGSYSIELSSHKPGDKFENFKNTYYEGNGRDEFNADWNDILNQMISLDNVITQMNSSRKPVKSSGLNFEGGNPYAAMVRNPWGMKKQKSDMIDEITEDDISKALDAIRTSPESTWYKKLYSFGDGTSLYFAAGIGEGYDEDDVVCGKIACLSDNSAMSEYNYDFLMPYNPETGDVYDTDSELTQGSADWYNDSAKTIVEMINNGELATK